MTRPCRFCERTPFEARVFYDRDNWYAFLSVPRNAVGHAVLAVKRSDAGCPIKLLPDHVRGLDVAIADVVKALTEHYAPKDVLVASLRALDPHVHWHIVPLHEDQEREWRLTSGYEAGHMFEYLADIDKDTQSRASVESALQLADALRPEVERLRAITGYKPGPTSPTSSRVRS